MAGEGFPNRGECYVVFIGRSSGGPTLSPPLGEQRRSNSEPALQRTREEVKERENNEVSDGNSENVLLFSKNEHNITGLSV